MNVRSRKTHRLAPQSARLTLGLLQPPQTIIEAELQFRLRAIDDSSSPQMIEVTHELCRAYVPNSLSPFFHMSPVIHCSVQHSNVPQAELVVFTGTWYFTLHSSNMCLCTCEGIGKKGRLHGRHAVNCCGKGLSHSALTCANFKTDTFSVRGAGP